MGLELHFGNVKIVFRSALGLDKVSTKSAQEQSSRMYGKMGVIETK